jgi:antitoxin CcdA
MRMDRAHTNSRTRKRATNVTIDADLLTRAKALGLNVSSAVEDGLRARIREEEIRRWHAENKEAIEALNKETREHGLWYDRWRRF